MQAFQKPVCAVFDHRGMEPTASALASAETDSSAQTHVSPEVANARKLAREEIEAGRLDQALKTLSEMIEKHPECHLSYMDRACLHFLMHNFHAGFEDLHACIRVTPLYFSEFISIANAQLRINRPKASLGVILFVIMQATTRIPPEQIIDALTSLSRVLFDSAQKAESSQKPEKMDDYFRCNICNYLLVAPVTNACGHSLCFYCADITHICPTCRFPWLRESGQTSVALDQIISIVDAESHSTYKTLSHIVKKQIKCPDEAAEKLEKLVVEKPDSVPVAVLKISSLQSKGKITEALLQSFASLRQSPRSLDLLCVSCQVINSFLSSTPSVEESVVTNMLHVTAFYFREFLMRIATNEVSCSRKRQSKILQSLEPLLLKMANTRTLDTLIRSDWPHNNSIPCIAGILSDLHRFAQSMLSQPPSQSQPQSLPTDGPLLAKRPACQPDECGDESRGAKQSVRRDSATPLRERILEELQCVLCMELMLDPVTTSCGHSFCKVCLTRNLDHRNTCPQCRADLRDYINPELQVVDQTLSGIIQIEFKAEYEERMKSHQKEVAQQRQYLPIFMCSLLLPHIECPLHIFEPRYRLMVRRAMESGEKRFGMVVHDGPWEEDGHAVYGTTVEIRSVDLLEDGRSLVDAYGGKRFRMVGKSVQDGYLVAQVEWIEDIDQNPMTEEDIANPSLNRNHLQTRIVTNLVRRRAVELLQALGRRAAAIVERQNGPMPPETQPSEFSFWIMNLLPINPIAKYQFLKLRSVFERYQRVAALMGIEIPIQISDPNAPQMAPVNPTTPQVESVAHVNRHEEDYDDDDDNDDDEYVDVDEDEEDEDDEYEEY